MMKLVNGELETVEIRFTVAGKETSDERRLVNIPERFAAMFEGHDFKTEEEFRLAVMNANTANSANAHGVFVEEAACIRELKWVLAK